MESEAADAVAEVPASDFGFSQAIGEGAIVERATAVDIKEPPPSDIAVLSPGETIAIPQIAYRYALGFRLPANAIKPLQNKHADLCESRGPQVCRIISMRQADQDGSYAYGNRQIAVAANEARPFSK